MVKFYLQLIISSGVVLQGICCLLANARCILTANVAEVGDKTYELKSNVDTALKIICQQSLRKGKSGSRPSSASSSNVPTPSSSHDQGASICSESDVPEKGSPVVQEKPLFTVLVSNQYYAESNLSLPKSDNCSYFNLEEVKKLHFMNQA